MSNLKHLSFTLLAILIIISQHPPSSADTPAPPVESITPPIGAASTLDEKDIRPMAQRLGDVFDKVDLQEITAREFVQWWSSATGIRVLANWELLEAQGINPRQPLTLQFERIAIGRVLALAMQLMSNDSAVLMVELSDHAIELMTKADANKRLVTRVYNVTDRLHVIDDERLPRVNTTGYLAGGGGSRGLGNITFESRGGTRSAIDRARARLEAGERLADEIRETIEPALWREQGGQIASIRFLRDRLVVTAPRYVQSQVAEYLGVGLADIMNDDPMPMRHDSPGTSTQNPAATSQTQGISGVQPSPGSPISGVQGR